MWATHKDLCGCVLGAKGGNWADKYVWRELSNRQNVRSSLVPVASAYAGACAGDCGVWNKIQRPPELKGAEEGER